MKKVTTEQAGGGIPYDAPRLELIDVRIEKGFANSFPGGEVETMSAVWTRYGDYEEL